MLKVVGIVGPIASGKGMLVDTLKKNGFKTFSLGDRVREEAGRLALPHDRSTLQDVGNALREKFGDDILVRQTEKLFDTSKTKIAIDGVRNPGEISYLQKQYNALIIGVNAPVEKRKNFSKKRKADADPISAEEFARVEKRDRGIGQTSHGQQVDACLKLCDIVIDNNGTLEEFKEKIRKALDKLDLQL